MDYCDYFLCPEFYMFLLLILLILFANEANLFNVGFLLEPRLNRTSFRRRVRSLIVQINWIAPVSNVFISS